MAKHSHFPYCYQKPAVIDKTTIIALTNKSYHEYFIGLSACNTLYANADVVAFPVCDFC